MRSPLFGLYAPRFGRWGVFFLRHPLALALDVTDMNGVANGPPAPYKSALCTSPERYTAAVRIKD